ncbi:MAG: cytochrome c oxidase assembly factor Coa1 family protein [Planctomycetia bacterium]
MLRRTAVCCAFLLAMAGCSRLSSHPVVAAAKDEVSKNARVAAVLGERIEFSPSIVGRANETDGIAAMQFEATGPKGKGLVVVEGKKLGKEWGVTLLEIRPAGGGEHLHLTADLEERTGVDTPKFDPTAKPTSSSPAPPPGDIEITIPSGGPGGEG